MTTPWPTVPLGELCQTGAGGTPLKLHKDYYEGGTIPWLLSGEVNRKDIESASSFITKKGLDNSSAKIFPPGTVLVAMYGATAGQVGILRFEAASNQAVCGIYPGEKFVPEFLFHLLSHRKDELVAQASGNAQPNISQIKIRSTPVPVVPIAEQRRIVAILDEAFASIAIARANAEKNLQNARELFKSELEVIFDSGRMEWPMRSIDQMGAVQTGSTPKTSDTVNYGDFIPFIKPGDFRDDGSLDCSNEGLSKEGLSKARRISHGSVLMVCIGATIGKCGYSEQDVTTNQQINSVTPAQGVSPKFVYLQMLTAAFQRAVRSNAGQATLPIINKSKWSALRLAIPKTLDEQMRVVRRLDAIRSETRRLEAIYERKLAALDELKQSLLHQAFSGQL